MKRIFVDVERCTGCKTCEIVCAIKHSKTKNILEVIKEEPNPYPRVKVIKTETWNIPLMCRHCPYPACEKACISGAIRKNEEGFISIDKNKCVHCYSCIMACSYGVIKMDKEGNVAIKCDLCRDEEIPPCVRSCPTKALFYGEEEEFEEFIKRRREKCII